MIVVIASRLDGETASVVNSWQSQMPVSILTPESFCQLGLRWNLENCMEGTFSLFGRVYQTSEIQGILTRLAIVSEIELPMVSEPDRSYVASEIQAFLVGWLSAFQCPVLNQPSAQSLIGPGWSKEKWVNVASKLGFATVPLHQSSGGISSTVSDFAEWITVTVIGASIFNAPDESFASDARRLAEFAGVSLLAIRACCARFQNGKTTWCFESASSLVDLGRQDISTSVMKLMSRSTS